MKSDNCPCYKECKTCPGFQKILAAPDAGFIVYRHTTRVEDINKTTGTVETTTDTIDDVFIIENTQDAPLGEIDITSGIDTRRIRCPRCVHVIQKAQRLLKSKKIDRSNVIGICEHCRQRTQTGWSCVKCEEVVKKFEINKHTQKQSQRIKTWLSKIQRLIKLTLADEKKDKNQIGKLIRRHSDLNINNLLKKMPISDREPEIEDLFSQGIGELRADKNGPYSERSHSSGKRDKDVAFYDTAKRFDDEEFIHILKKYHDDKGILTPSNVTLTEDEIERDFINKYGISYKDKDRKSQSRGTALDGYKWFEDEIRNDFVPVRENHDDKRRKEFIPEADKRYYDGAKMDSILETHKDQEEEKDRDFTLSKTNQKEKKWRDFRRTYDDAYTKDLMDKKEHYVSEVKIPSEDLGKKEHFPRDAVTPEADTDFNKRKQFISPTDKQYDGRADVSTITRPFKETEKSILKKKQPTTEVLYDSPSRLKHYRSEETLLTGVRSKKKDHMKQDDKFDYYFPITEAVTAKKPRVASSSELIKDTLDKIKTKDEVEKKTQEKSDGLKEEHRKRKLEQSKSGREEKIRDEKIAKDLAANFRELKKGKDQESKKGITEPKEKLSLDQVVKGKEIKEKDVIKKVKKEIPEPKKKERQVVVAKEEKPKVAKVNETKVKDNAKESTGSNSMNDKAKEDKLEFKKTEKQINVAKPKEEKAKEQKVKDNAKESTGSNSMNDKAKEDKLEFKKTEKQINVAKPKEEKAKEQKVTTEKVKEEKVKEEKKLNKVTDETAKEEKIKHEKGKEKEVKVTDTVSDKDKLRRELEAERSKQEAIERDKEMKQLILQKEEERKQKLEEAEKAKQAAESNKDKPKPEKVEQKLEMTKIKILKPDICNLIDKMNKPKERKKVIIPSPIEIMKHKSHGYSKKLSCDLCRDSDLELDVIDKARTKEEQDVGKELNDAIIGEKIYKFKSHLHETEAKEANPPMLFHKEFGDYIDEPYYSEIKPAKSKSVTKPVTDNYKGVVRYYLSDRQFIEKGWTMLPTEKVVRKMNVYRMRPSHPEFDWFEHNKKRGDIQYDSGEKLADFDEKGRGRVYYRSGKLALDYYSAEELNAQQRFVIYSSGEPDERGRSHPRTVLATFDYLGNGVVFDHAGKIRLKYNQTEGVVLDRTLGPASHWKWHALNDPPVLQQVMLDTQLSHKDPNILKLGGSLHIHPRPDDETMLGIEFDNFIKEKSAKLSQTFKPFQIKMKALKINEYFSLRVLDQATVYLIYRDGTTNIKLNIGMILDHKEIVDTDTAEVGEVSNSVERLPAKTDSIAELQRHVANAQRTERARVERERRIQRPEASASADRFSTAISKPLKFPLRTVDSTVSTGVSRLRKCRKPSTRSVYYDTSLI